MTDAALINSARTESTNTGMLSPARLNSLDAIRGFDMFWIIGGEEIFHALAEVTHAPFWIGVSTQFTHPSWNGFRFYDLIFPLFIFIAGVSTPYSIGKKLEQGTSRQKLMLMVVRRGLLLILLGLIYNNGLKLHPLEDIRFSSVLGRIGISYIFANAIYLYSKEYTQIIWFAGLLVGYWLILKFTAAPGYSAGDLSMEGNFASYVDRSILPGRLSLKIHDTVGFFNNIPAVSSALAGILTGSFLKKSSLTLERKAIAMAACGIGFILLALLWNLDFPINKNLWSSSFVLYTVGWSLILFSVFYYVIDVRGFSKWSFFFSVIGMNSILIYMSNRFIHWDYMNDGLFGWVPQLIQSPYYLVIMAITLLAIKWLFLFVLYRKNIFMRV
jgi:predicted acyltransferase